MIYFRLFVSFLYVGFFSFGGSVSAIPLVREISLNNKWLTLEEFENIIAISESTPGGLIANLATYVGALKAGFIGSLIATLGAILPAFFIIIIVNKFLNKVIKNERIKYIFFILRVCILGLIFGIGCFLLIDSIGLFDYFINIKDSILNEFYLNNNFFYREYVVKIIILVLVLFVMALYKKFSKKPISSILLIFISALLGIIINMLL